MVSVVALACASKQGSQLPIDAATDADWPTIGNGGSGGLSGAGGNGGFGYSVDSGLDASGGSDNSFCWTGNSALVIDAGLICPNNPNSEGLGAYIDISGDGDPIRLLYPEPDDGTCIIVGRETVCCATYVLSFSACAGPQGTAPCLDSGGGHYMDRNGKIWAATVQLGISNSKVPYVLDQQATAPISDGSTTRSLSIHIHICGDTYYCGIIC